MILSHNKRLENLEGVVPAILKILEEQNQRILNLETDNKSLKDSALSSQGSEDDTKEN